jgi:hypothetical protein
VGGCVCGGGWGTALLQLLHPQKSVLVSDTPQLRLRGGVVPDMLVTNSCPTNSRATNSVPQLRLRGGVGQERLRACAAQLKRRPREQSSHPQPPRHWHLQPPLSDTSDEEDADCGDKEGGRGGGGMGGDKDCGDKESELAVSSGMDDAREGGGGGEGMGVDEDATWGVEERAGKLHCVLRGDHISISLADLDSPVDDWERAPSLLFVAAAEGHSPLEHVLASRGQIFYELLVMGTRLCIYIYRSWPPCTRACVTRGGSFTNE